MPVDIPQPISLRLTYVKVIPNRCRLDRYSVVPEDEGSQRDGTGERYLGRDGWSRSSEESGLGSRSVVWG